MLNQDITKVPRVCTYCGATDHLEQMGRYASYKCEPGHGCQKEYTPGWGMYLFGALHVDIPYIIVFGLIIKFAYWILAPALSAIPDAGTILLGVLFGVFSLLLPLILTFNGIPMFFSMLVLSIYSLNVIFD